MALVRDLFGISVAEDALAAVEDAPGTERPGLAEVRELRAQGGAGGGRPA
jgi:hypothetical protein